MKPNELAQDNDNSPHSYPLTAVHRISFQITWHASVSEWSFIHYDMKEARSSDTIHFANEVFLCK